MALTGKQAKELSESLNDVFTPEGYGGVIARLYTFTSPKHPLYGKGQCALVDVTYQPDEWWPISELESSETLAAQRAAEDGQ
ncbi:MAG TPA: hypothetical protein VL652_23180 [Kutzneria sp.]|jgi:hypothetical protein|nr:hypothetical protein [Kutzneria sp.]